MKNKKNYIWRIAVAALVCLAVFLACKEELYSKRSQEVNLQDSGEADNTEGLRMEDFPSVLEEFVLEEFTEAFFERNTLILVPFEWPGKLREYLDFYTVFIENGKMNVLFEVTHPTGLLDGAVDVRLFVIVIPNEIFGKYDIGEMIVFETYDFSVVDKFGNPIEKNPHEWLNEIQEKSIVHRVGLFYSSYLGHETNVIHGLNVRHVLQLENKITVVDSVESLQEYFYISADE